MTNGRRKGHDYEREVASYFRSHGFQAQRAGSAQQRRGNAKPPDVELAGIPLWLEVRRGKQPNPRRALRDAITASEAHPATWRWRAGIVRDDRDQAFVVLPLSDFADLLRAWWRSRRPTPARQQHAEHRHNDERQESLRW